MLMKLFFVKLIISLTSNLCGQRISRVMKINQQHKEREKEKKEKTIYNV